MSTRTKDYHIQRKKKICKTNIENQLSLIYLRESFLVGFFGLEIIAFVTKHSY